MIYTFHKYSNIALLLTATSEHKSQTFAKQPAFMIIYACEDSCRYMTRAELRKGLNLMIYVYCHVCFCMQEQHSCPVLWCHLHFSSALRFTLSSYRPIYWDFNPYSAVKVRTTRCTTFSKKNEGTWYSTFHGLWCMVHPLTVCTLCQ